KYNKKYNNKYIKNKNNNKNKYKFIILSCKSGSYGNNLLFYSFKLKLEKNIDNKYNFKFKLKKTNINNNNNNNICLYGCRTLLNGYYFHIIFIMHSTQINNYLSNCFTIFNLNNNLL